MHNIPPLKPAQPPVSRLNRRANKIVRSEDSTENQPVLPGVDRRRQQDRRKKKQVVSLERRIRNNNRRKKIFFAQDTEHSVSLGDTLGKFINTEV